MSMSKFATQADYWKDRAERAESVLSKIASLPDVSDEWDAWDKLTELRDEAAKALGLDSHD